MEIDKYLNLINAHYKLDLILKDHDQLFSILNEDHSIYLDDLYVKKFDTDVLDRAARIIQRYLRRYVDNLIYKKIKNVLENYRYENPSRLLKRKCIKEARLFDKINCHYLEFRLNGEMFPPTIVYKIYSNMPIIKGINTFQTDVIPITMKRRDNMLKNNDKWEIIYRYKRNSNCTRSHKNKWKTTQVTNVNNNQKHTRNKQALTWISSRYK